MSVINIKKGKRKTAGGDTPADVFEESTPPTPEMPPITPPVSASAVGTFTTAPRLTTPKLDELYRTAVAMGDTYSAVVYCMANIKPLDAGFAALTAILDTAGCGECHRGDTLRLVMRDGGHAVGHAIFIVACGADNSVLNIPVDVVAVSRCAPTALIPTIAKEITTALRSHGWERWPERETGTPGIRLQPREYAMLQELIGAARGYIRRDDFRVCGVPVYVSNVAPVTSLAPTRLIDLVHEWIEPCRWCGAPNHWQCTRSCTRPVTLASQLLVHRASP